MVMIRIPIMVASKLVRKFFICVYFSTIFLEAAIY